MRQRSSPYHWSVLDPNSIGFKLISLFLVCVIAFGELPVYAVDKALSGRERKGDFVIWHQGMQNLAAAELSMRPDASSGLMNSVSVLGKPMSETYGYDANGNMTSRKDFNGHTTTYQYDNMNRLKTKTADTFFSTGACAPGACGPTQVTFTYTSTGRRQSMTDASGKTNYSYATRDRLL